MLLPPFDPRVLTGCHKLNTNTDSCKATARGPCACGFGCKRVARNLPTTRGHPPSAGATSNAIRLLLAGTGARLLIDCQLPDFCCAKTCYNLTNLHYEPQAVPYCLVEQGQATGHATRTNRIGRTHGRKTTEGVEAQHHAVLEARACEITRHFVGTCHNSAWLHQTDAHSSGWATVPAYAAAAQKPQNNCDCTTTRPTPQSR